MNNPDRVYRVDLGTRSYDIHIQPGCLDGLGKTMRSLFPATGRCLIVSNEVVAPLYLERVRQSLESSGWDAKTCILADGEQHKTLASWNSILDAMMLAKLSRGEPVIALGGGVVGDMTGFAAASYRRGIPYVQVPTTLLAQVDSSVGGKTAINHPHGKNMIGAFYQPALVWIDPLVLSTLAPRELRAGVAELIKYGLIRDTEFFTYLQQHMQSLLTLEADTVAEVIYHSCRHKAEVVVSDETEQGVRALLNLGHTFGHAIESMTHYTQYLHGEAVALGTLMAARLSAKLGYVPKAVEGHIRELYVSCGLPVDIPKFSADAWLDAMGHDKKNVGRRIRFILLKQIGEAFVAEDVDEASVRELIASFS
ncbi:MAG: 3-dehydroquinate synthase [Zetaproteobacteria bacterium CG12_big_fil_rev_8_21_14_0_65_55_1124]|nr:MAG: 3-dehydroquinate synthase [Zetaproteobacteria bacterium CG1_02_55_237]PIS19191.1 MAG: 3-dehydroquinate synthase [Zetaproteobacteria bacterium CG08_land_8_20_14_0_20_55_17]PIW43887.1 MAG: 3-dehydroquinate synthase [Zetaproteobacteria bacterium CG12_big_fil_rev_8_21_14_0_65_55_1124]PIY53034.1 MAG: 3-dehydroquinate synthase [Zetaproteobacteria bacterium CG_4_10_14_0_8_um_filter_55_43]PIZ37667.1 MAG: 3-dehydroquinate synthase [Zetaproteobacteria bacterium CG_4_10_14_0_2_um_filter_55_20]PJB